MALDTREKRMNAARVGRSWLRAKHAVGATDQQARIASGHGYGGNALPTAWSREKRMNMARVARPWLRAKHAVGATDQQARIASGHGYGGNALSPIPVPAITMTISSTQSLTTAGQLWVLPERGHRTPMGAAA